MIITTQQQIIIEKKIKQMNLLLNITTTNSDEINIKINSNCNLIKS